MSATTTTNPALPAPAAPKPRRKRGRAVVLSNVDWRTYTRLLKALDERPRLRLTYDRGELEIMVTSSEHEGDVEFVGRLILVLTEAFQLPVRSGGSVTMKRKQMKRGLEPDRCFWIANAAKIVGVKRLDLKIHPPPDLAIEVDVTSSSMNRFRIYAALGVPEVWRLDGDDLTFHQRSGKKYAEVPTSPTFAGIAPGDLMAFVKQARAAVDENVTVAAFRAWLQARLAPPPATP